MSAISQDIIKGLRPFRDQIDAIDDEILSLLKRRFDVVQDVIAYKSRHQIPASLQDRVDEVHNRNVATAMSLGLSQELVSRLYTDIIDATCAYEADIMPHADHPEERLPSESARRRSA